jgi:CelD/BcsL family acetyltransferase involved in cellulose biosynthesis
MQKTAGIQTQLRVEEIHEERAFELLNAEWNQLAAHVSSSVFLRHEWFSAAWAWRRADARLRILGVYTGETLVGVLPLIIRTNRARAGGRLLEFLTVPDTQCCDLIAEPRNAPVICEALVDHLVSRASEWDALWLERLPAHSLTQTALQPVLAVKGLNCRLEANDCNLFVDLEGLWEDYYATRSRSFKKAFNLAANRLTRAGAFQVERLSSSRVDRQRMQRFLDDVVSISSRSWKRNTGTTLDVAGPRAFIHKLTDHAYASDWLSLWLLRIHGKPVAMEYQLVYDEHVHALRADFDEAYKNLSPGSYLSCYLVQELFANGFKRYYMGPGKNPYKRRWSKTGDALYTLTGYAPTLRGRAAALWPHEVKPKLRTLRDRLTPVVAAYVWLCAHTPEVATLLSGV